MSNPELQPIGMHYRPGLEPVRFEPEITEDERTAVFTALDYAKRALADGNPPVGAVLIANDLNFQWAASTDDKTKKTLRGHAEMRVYEEAEDALGDDLSNCTLVTTAQPCTSCTPPYAEGKIGKIIYSAPRDLIYPLTGIMRPRRYNLPELIEDGDTDTQVVANLGMVASLNLFAQYGKMRGHTPGDDVPQVLQAILRGIEDREFSRA